MSISTPEWEQERQRVYTVTRKITEQIQQEEEQIEQIKSDVVELRKHFWDEVSVNFSTFDDALETQSSIRHQAEVLSERERRYNHSSKRFHILKRMSESPYFGRIDFDDSSYLSSEPIYIGLTSFIDSESQSFMVYDWRSPIASLYYDFSPGPATYLAPMGLIEGMIHLKRQYVIRHSEIAFMFDTNLTIGDELLMQSLSKHSESQLKSIVTTIQQEQNQIIRNRNSQLLVVNGPAGSGKTSAVLQRIAYLMFHYRDTLSPEQFVLLSPNPLFTSYISSVLPELGEENIEQTTFQDYLEYRLGNLFKIEDLFSQIEYRLTLSNDLEYRARMLGIHYKASIHFMELLQSYVQLLEQKNMIFLPVVFQQRILISGKTIEEKFYSFDSTQKITSRIELLKKWLLKQVILFAQKEIRAAWVEEELNFLSSEDYHKAYQKMKKLQRNQKTTFDDYDVEKRILSEMVLQKHLSPLRQWISENQFVDMLSLYKQLFVQETVIEGLLQDHLPLHDWKSICQHTLKFLGHSELPYEDATPFLYLHELILGQFTNTQVRYVFIDEAQDYTPFQMAYLKLLFPRSKMTILGDLNQSMDPQNSSFMNLFSSFQQIVEHPPEIITLTKSYRSTYEIVTFTRDMLNSQNDIIPFHRNGEKPSLLIANQQEKYISMMIVDIKELMKQGHETIAIICKTARESAEIHTLLQADLPIKVITKFTPNYEKGIIILPVYLAKGVEFDAVIIHNASKDHYREASELNLLYTACTRAMHILHIFVLGQISSFLTPVHSETYTIRTVSVHPMQP